MKIAFSIAMLVVFSNAAHAAPMQFDLQCHLKKTSGHIHFNGAHTAGEDSGESVENYAVDLSAMKYWALNSSLKGNFPSRPVPKYQSGKVIFSDGGDIFFSYDRSNGTSQQRVTQDDGTKIIYSGRCTESAFGK